MAKNKTTTKVGAQPENVREPESNWTWREYAERYKAQRNNFQASWREEVENSRRLASRCNELLAACKSATDVLRREQAQGWDTALERLSNVIESDADTNQIQEQMAREYHLRSNSNGPAK